AVGFNANESGYDKIGNSYTDACRMIGMGMTKTFFKVDIHLIECAILRGFILSFIEIMKDLLLTLIFIQFNFHPLSTKVLQYVYDDQIHEAAFASIIIIVISAIAIYLFHHVLEKEQK